MHGRTNIVTEPRQRQLSRLAPSTKDGRPFVHGYPVAGTRQDESSGQPVGAGADNDGLITVHSVNTAQGLNTPLTASIRLTAQTRLTAPTRLTGAP